MKSENVVIRLGFLGLRRIIAGRRDLLYLSGWELRISSASLVSSTSSC